MTDPTNQTNQENKPDLSFVRTAWRVLEPYHAMIYFSPEARAAFKDAGLKGYWMGYFAARSAPLGIVPTPVVSALFYNFHPRMVNRALPDAWSFTTPERMRELRLQSADVTLRRLLGEPINWDEVAEAAELARQAAENCPVEGRALFAAFAALPWPTEPHLVLWHATTLLREFRGDGHVAALLGAGIDGCQAHIMQVASGKTPRKDIQTNRGWSDEEWEASQQRMLQRGLLDAHGQFTPAGRALYQSIEERTDQLALPPWQHLGAEKATRLISLVRPLSSRVVEQGGVPMPNPIGVPKP
ncbi:MAG: hypothetical protein NVSMB44_23380 [Ktedonobacteraceae bacterium]